MKKKYVVFWIGQERKIYGDDNYYVLGENMGVFNTEELALKRIESLNLGRHEMCTVITVYSGEGSGNGTF